MGGSRIGRKIKDPEADGMKDIAKGRHSSPAAIQTPSRKRLTQMQKSQVLWKKASAPSSVGSKAPVIIATASAILYLWGSMTATRFPKR